MRGSVALAVLVCAIGVARPARADAPCPQASSTCLDHTPPLVVRAHGGIGVFLNGGAVAAGVAPNLLEHARVSGMLAVEVGARPFGGGATFSLIFAGQLADGAVVGTLGISIEYDLLYLFGDRSPNREFNLALGGALAMDYAHSWVTAAAGVVSTYDLMRPDWRTYVELRIRAGVRDQGLVRVTAVSGFDDFLDLASITLSGGYVFQGL